MPTVKPVSLVKAETTCSGSCAPPTSATPTAPDPLRGAEADPVPWSADWADPPCGTMGSTKGSAGAFAETAGVQAASARADTASRTTRVARALVMFPLG